MSKQYPNLLSPIKVGNVIFKNRLTATASKPHFIQGSEPYPTEAMITHFANKAKNGAALVTFGGIDQLTNQKLSIVTEKFMGFDGHGYARHRVAAAIGMPNPADSVESYLSQLTEAVHFYGSKASICLIVNAPDPYDVSAGLPIMGPPGKDGNAPRLSKEITEDLINKIVDEYALQAAFAKDLGFDMVTLLPLFFIERFLSPLINKRTDQYGGNPENRARFPLMVADRIKQKCGDDFLIELLIGVQYKPWSGGITLEDTINYAKMFEGHFDLLQLRAGDLDPQHPTNYILERTPFLSIAEAVKQSGVNIAVVTVGGYLDLGICENVIATGKADFIGMARSWISNPDYGRLAYEGRGEDVVPCLRCNKCHVNTYAAPLASVCSVNPTWGFEHKIERMVSPSTGGKKIAVVGGGPAGMEAALVASRRGHHVTLYEKSDGLGGLLKTSNYPSFKWPLRAFKNHLISQIKKSNVKVYLNTEATAEMLKKEKYDAVFAAVGGEPVIPDITGVNGKNVLLTTDIYGKEGTLAENVVIIGGGETGVETGMYLAEKGHNVTVLEKGDMLASKATPVHFYSMLKAAWERLENFQYILEARCKDISEGKVTYIDTRGVEHSIEAGSVVIAVGFKSKNELAMQFTKAGDRFFIVGDCNKIGSVQTAMRSAYCNACML